VLQERIAQAHAREVDTLHAELAALRCLAARDAPAQAACSAADVDGVRAAALVGPQRSWRSRVLSLPRLLGEDSSSQVDDGDDGDSQDSAERSGASGDMDEVFGQRAEVAKVSGREPVKVAGLSRMKSASGLWADPRHSFRPSFLPNFTPKLSSLEGIASLAEGRGEREGSRARFLAKLQIVWDTGISMVIVLNAIAIGISCDSSPDWEGWAIVDCCFAVIFLSEVVINCAAGGVRLYFLGPEWRWHSFEVVLVVLALLEVCITFAMPSSADSNASHFEVFKVLRLLRVARIARVGRLSIFKELSVLITGTLGGMRTLAFSMLLLALPLYSAALIFRELLGSQAGSGNGAEVFATLSQSFFTLFRCIVAADCTERNGKPIFVQVTAAYGWIYGAIYAGLIFFMTLGLFNVIAAIFVENVVIGAKTSARLVRRQKLRDKAFYASKIVELVEVIVTTGLERHHRSRHCKRLSMNELLEKGRELKLTPELFEVLRLQPRFCEILSDLDIAEDDQFDLFDMLDTDGSGSVDIEELLDGISRLRGEARRSDVVCLNFMIRSSQLELRKVIEHHSKYLRHMIKDLASQRRQAAAESSQGIIPASA